MLREKATTETGVLALGLRPAGLCPQSLASPQLWVSQPENEIKTWVSLYPSTLLSVENPSHLNLLPLFSLGSLGRDLLQWEDGS